jgi:hypothetical protein
MSVVMRKLVFVFVFLVAVLSSSRLDAQFVVSSGMFGRTSFKVTAQVLDSLTKEPVAFASVYLRHPDDTVITAFALTDTLGKAALKDVAKGEHLLCIEYLGYRPVYRKIYIRLDDYDAKVVLMQPDDKVLKAATVSASGNLVEMRGDTLIYNASSYRLMSNDKLSDLLKKMPGVEVGDDGTVKVNGKEVDRITVNGRTFFLGDNKAALDNLPARVVDKVKVIDKESESAGFTGIKGEKEKVMDVELKEEYKSGWFGNAQASGGTTVYDKDDNGFKEKKDALLSGSAMVSVYGKKNMLTSIASGYNFFAPGSGIVISGMQGDAPSLPYDGMHTRWQVGSNLNSDEIKGFTTDISVVYSSDKVDKRTRTDRTTFKEEGDLSDISNETVSGDLDKLNVRLELRKKDTKKTSLYFRPYFSWYGYSSTSTGNASSLMGDEERNSSATYSYTGRRGVSTGGDLTAGVRKLGKDRRALTLDFGYSFGSYDGDATERSTTRFTSSDEPDVRDLTYDKDGGSGVVKGTLSYVEPFGKKWALNASLSSNYSVRKSTDDAADADGTANLYYSSVSDNYYFSNEGRLLAQYDKGRTNLQLGGEARLYKNENYARSYGVDTRTGVGEWQTTFSPFLNLRYSDDRNNLSLRMSSNTARPSSASILPTFSIVNPTRITAGNIYLKPVTSEAVSAGYRATWGKVRFNGYLSGNYSSNSQVSAIWFDSNSVRYSVPVNTKKPSYSSNLNFSAFTPLAKNLRVALTGGMFVSRSVGYQSVGTLDGIDLDSFDYTDFMAGFWGDASGDRFYSGESGFRESSTSTFRKIVTLSLDLSLEDFSLSFMPSVDNVTSRYSLDSKADTDYWDTSLALSASYTSPHEFEFESDFTYDILRGYGSGYDDAYADCSVTVGKNIRSFYVSLSVQDLFDSARSLRRVVQDDYVQNSYTNVLGRCVLLSLTWNFGKMDASKSGAAQKAMWKMAF